MKSSVGFRYLWLEMGEPNSTLTQSIIVPVNKKRTRNNQTPFTEIDKFPL